MAIFFSYTERKQNLSLQNMPLDYFRLIVIFSSLSFYYQISDNSQKNKPKTLQNEHYINMKST